MYQEHYRINNLVGGNMIDQISALQWTKMSAIGLWQPSGDAAVRSLDPLAVIYLAIDLKSCNLCASWGKAWFHTQEPRISKTPPSTTVADILFIRSWTISQNILAPVERYHALFTTVSRSEREGTPNCLHLAPATLMIFRSNSKFDQNWECSS